MIIPIFKQTEAGECGWYSLLNTLIRLWVDITEAQLKTMPRMMWVPAMRQNLKKYGLWKGIVQLVSPRLIENTLKQGIPLICLMYGNNFASVRKTGIQDFKWTMQHYVCLESDYGDRIRYVDQQGESFWDKWHWYIMKTDLNKTKIYKVNV